MNTVTEPATGLRFVELSHPFKHDMPTIPGYNDMHMWRPVTHAKHGVMSHRVKMQMHTGTHINAPIHLIQGGAGVGDLDVRLFFGPGLILDVAKGPWESITGCDLENAGNVRSGDIVIIRTGWHTKYADSQEYFGQAPGLTPEAADYLVSKAVKMVGVDTPFIDHPLATSMGEHRNGPQIRRLADRYAADTGRDPLVDFPEWNPAHRILLGAGIPTIENVGGDLDAVAGSRCTLHAMPWRWAGADACMIRLVAITDPAGTYRLESGGAQ